MTTRYHAERLATILDGQGIVVEVAQSGDRNHITECDHLWWGVRLPAGAPDRTLYIHPEEMPADWRHALTAETLPDYGAPRWLLVYWLFIGAALGFIAHIWIYGAN